MMQKHRPIKEADELYCPNFISTAMIKYPDHMQLGRKRAYFCLQFQLQTKHRGEGGSRLRQLVTSQPWMRSKECINTVSFVGSQLAFFSYSIQDIPYSNLGNDATHNKLGLPTSMNKTIPQRHAHRTILIKITRPSRLSS